MLDPTYWSASPGNAPSFLIDPRGVANGVRGKFGNNQTAIPRISLTYLNSPALADQVFLWPDDLIVDMPEDMVPKQPIGRPTLMADPTTKQLIPKGDYSWFATVTPMPNNPTRFNVSIVVCCKRILTQASERAVQVTSFFDNGLGGGSIQLSREINDIAGDATAGTAAGIAVKENDWVALCSQKGLCRWYRIASIGDNTQYLTLIGPDWTPAAGDQVVTLGRA